MRESKFVRAARRKAIEAKARLDAAMACERAEAPRGAVMIEYALLAAGAVALALVINAMFKQVGTTFKGSTKSLNDNAMQMQPD